MIYTVEETAKKIGFKFRYYETAKSAGTTAVPRGIKPEDPP